MARVNQALAYFDALTTLFDPALATDRRQNRHRVRSAEGRGEPLQIDVCSRTRCRRGSGSGASSSTVTATDARSEGRAVSGTRPPCTTSSRAPRTRTCSSIPETCRQPVGPCNAAGGRQIAVDIRSTRSMIDRLERVVEQQRAEIDELRAELEERNETRTVAPRIY
jgi:hypothetical protein